jgi:predicted dehydrogenase
MTALRAGKHVYVQKTVATNLKDAQEIFAEARRRDLVAVASPQQMLNPTRQAARELIAQGAIGQVFWALGSTNSPGHEVEQARLGQGPLDRIDPTWYFEAGSGPVFDMSVYSLHTITGLLGPVQRVTAFSGLRVPLRKWKGQELTAEVDDNTMLLLDFGDDVYALVNGSTAFPGRSIGWGHLSIYGAEGALEIYSENPSEPNLASVVEVVGGDTYRFNDFGPYLPSEHAQMGDPHVYADVMHFVECVASGAGPQAYGAQACHVVEVIEKGYYAARSGQTQQIVTSFQM